MLRQTPRRGPSRSVRKVESTASERNSKAKKIRAAMLRIRSDILFGPSPNWPLDHVQVFVSYARENEATAGDVVRDLRGRGFRVGWDRDLAAGMPYREQITRAIAKAGATVVIWCQAAGKSAHVTGEAKLAQKRRRLICTIAEGSTASKCIPLDFEALHTIDVRDIDRIVRELERLGVFPGV